MNVYLLTHNLKKKEWSSVIDILKYYRNIRGKSKSFIYLRGRLIKVEDDNRIGPVARGVG